MKVTLQGLEVKDLALLLHAIQSVYVADMEPRRTKLEAKLKAALLPFGVTGVTTITGGKL